MSKGNADVALPARPRPLLILYADGSLEMPGTETYDQALNIMAVVGRKAEMLHKEALAQKLRGLEANHAQS